MLPKTAAQGLRQLITPASGLPDQRSKEFFLPLRLVHNRHARRAISCHLE